MTLFFATLLVALLLIGLGTFQLVAADRAQRTAVRMLRSKPAAVVLLGIATAWFVWKLTQLGAPDFGNYKHWLILLFIATSVLSYFFIPDFLAVRGLAALLLLSSDAVLDAAYMEPPTTRLFLVGFIYAVIVACMYLASLPYRLRDFYEWLFRKPYRPRILAVCSLAYGLLLGWIAFTY
ncbi:MAG: hypothetical protein ABQ298_05365 [Puniceicoccaceae bacterium]